MTRLRHALPTLLLTLALFSMGTVSAPTGTPDTEADTKLKIMRLLNSDTVAQQEKAVRLISNYAHTGQFDKDFFRIMVTPLHAIVAEGETESLRIMAVSALYSIGTDEAMSGLEEQLGYFKSERLATVAKRAVAAYKAEKTATSRSQTAE